VEPTKHFGIYGLWHQDTRIVLVRKTRGPYTGLLDLPGGSPEPGESELTTLRRELQEECGVDLTRVLERTTFEFNVQRDSAGHPIDFTHTAVVSHTEVAGPVVHNITAEDVQGAVLATPDDTATVSPLVLMALEQLGL
jgi:ADP-ribose pyrophosphatase YjhB (NUDIX family)